MVNWEELSYEEKCAFLKRVYKGETEVTDWAGTPFEGYKTLDWIKYFINEYGGFDGAHHKDWVLDQVMRIAYGTPVIVTKAVWDGEGYHDENWRVNTGEPSKGYVMYVDQFEAGEYDCGVAP